MHTLVISLFDCTGNWAAPWASYPDTDIITVDQQPVPEGYEWSGRVHIQSDLSKDEGYDALKTLVSHLIEEKFPKIRIVLLMAPPCTDFASSGARHFKEKDKDGRTLASVALVRAAIRFRAWLSAKNIPVIWALENPVGRLARLVPELGAYSLIFNPSDYGGYYNPPVDAYTRRTCLWGNFVRPPFKPVQPIKVCAQGSWVQKLGGSSAKTKFERSKTPVAFAYAFYMANRNHHMDHE